MPEPGDRGQTAEREFQWGHLHGKEFKVLFGKPYKIQTLGILFKKNTAFFTDVLV
jgi:hypothetical protein